MIFFGRTRPEGASVEFSRVAVSLGLFAKGPASQGTVSGDFWAQLAAPRSVARKGWQVPRSPGGVPVLLHGWIDNRASLAAELGLPRQDDAVLYGAAVERWGDAADHRIVGDYAAIVALPSGTVRLARSPWSTKSLFYHANSEALVVSSILRPMFAAGVRKDLRLDAVDSLLSLRVPDAEQSAFRDIRSVPSGCVVHLRLDGPCRKDAWYDPGVLPAVRFRRDEDYVDAANALLAEAVGQALASSQSPGVTVSGGLDSAIVCDEVLRQLPPDRRLPSFTFHPLPEWDGKVQGHKFGDDRPWVEAFAAEHPRLDPTFVDNRGIAFDDRAEQLFLASDAGYPAKVAGSAYHGVFDAAREEGCDWLLTAGFGNQTFSSDAPWAWAEFARRGRWRQLWQLAAANLNDPRPIWRRVAAHAIVPQLPGPLRVAARRLAHPRQTTDRFASPFLLGSIGGEPPETQAAITGGDVTSQAQYVRALHQFDGLGAESVAGYEQVFGIQLRDVPHYRPLIEFCLGLPTDQFVRDGETRYLARRMAVGRMPEAQRTNRYYGEHNVDWHARLTPRVGDMRQQLQRIARHPLLGPAIDTDRAQAALDAWPDWTPDDEMVSEQLFFHIPAICYIARYVDFVTGRNEA
ncbi:MAG: asparagine synthase-related protein [Novosphingobium sp.]